MNEAPIEDEAAYRKLVSNERTKLLSSYMNSLSVAIFAVGGFAPFIATATSTEPHFGRVFGIMVVCWTMSGAIHWAARQALQDLRP